MKPLKLLALFVIPLGIIIAAVPPDRVKHFRLTADELLQEAGAGVQFVSPDVVADMLVQKDPSLRLIDVRTPEEFARGHIRQSKLIPLSNFGEQLPLAKLKQDKPVLIVCESGMRARRAAAMLDKQGYTDVAVLDGGVRSWQEAQLPLVKG